MVFTANPEDYTARGKIITPLKDRIGSEIRTHYPPALEHGMAHHRSRRPGPSAEADLTFPRYVREVVEGIAFAARRDKRIDERSGVSQRLPICAPRERGSERRAARAGRRRVARRAADVRHLRRAAVLTGKFELEYEGEMVGGGGGGPGAHPPGGGRGLLRLHGVGGLRSPVVQFFEAGGSLRIREDSPASEVAGAAAPGPGGAGARPPAGRESRGPGPLAAAGEFVLEGLWAQKKVGRSDERGFVAAERPRDLEVDLERLERLRKLKKQVN